MWRTSFSSYNMINAIVKELSCSKGTGCCPLPTLLATTTSLQPKWLRGKKNNNPHFCITSILFMIIPFASMPAAKKLTCVFKEKTNFHTNPAPSTKKCNGSTLNNGNDEPQPSETWDMIQYDFSIVILMTTTAVPLCTCSISTTITTCGSEL